MYCECQAHLDGEAELGQDRWQTGAIAGRDLLKFHLPAVWPPIWRRASTCNDITSHTLKLGIRRGTEYAAWLLCTVLSV